MGASEMDVEAGKQKKIAFSIQDDLKIPHNPIYNGKY